MVGIVQLQHSSSSTFMFMSMFITLCSWVEPIRTAKRTKERNITKGRIISKGLFGFLGFFQKTNEQIHFSTVVLLGKKQTDSFVQFLEESKATDSHFEIIMDLTKNLEYFEIDCSFWRFRTKF